MVTDTEVNVIPDEVIGKAIVCYVQANRLQFDAATITKLQNDIGFKLALAAAYRRGLMAGREEKRAASGKQPPMPGK